MQQPNAIGSISRQAESGLNDMVSLTQNALLRSADALEVGDDNL